MLALFVELLIRLIRLIRKENSKFVLLLTYATIKNNHCERRSNPEQSLIPKGTIMPRQEKCACRNQCDGTCRKKKPFVPLDEMPEDEQEELLGKINSFLGCILAERLFSPTTVNQPDVK